MVHRFLQTVINRKRMRKQRSYFGSTLKPQASLLLIHSFQQEKNPDNGSALSDPDEWDSIDQIPGRIVDDFSRNLP